MTVVLLSTLSFFAVTASRRWRQLRLGVAAPHFSLSGAEFGPRLKDVLIYVLGQRKMPNYRLAGGAHMLIFFGFVVLTLNSVLLWVRGYDADFDVWGVLALSHPVGALYSLVKEIFAALVLGGVVVFWYLRSFKHGRDSGDAEAVGERPRMTLSLEAHLILAIIATMMLADFLYVGASIRLHEAETGVPGGSLFEPIGSLVATLLEGTSRPWLVRLQHLGFWWHASFVLIFLNILPFSKHFHIITVIPNVFTRDRRPNALPPVEDMDGKLDRDESLGIAKLTDLSWKHFLDLYTCTECGRCSDNCPAYLTDKKLSPKHLTIALRNHLYQTEEALFERADGLGDATASKSRAPAEGGIEPLHTYPEAPEDAYFECSQPISLVPGVISADVLWSCTTCRACEEQCPVMISYVDKIIGMRREEVMLKTEFPSELVGAFNGMENNGNPWNLSAMDRENWAEGLDVPTIDDHPDAEILYWVGCAASYDDRAKKVARALVQLLRHAEVDFAILGSAESCTGDPARRAGNEYLFQMLAEQNIETLNEHRAGEKTILTACPHCFNTLANEYGDFGGRYRVVHHSQYLAHLIAEGKLEPKRRVEGRVVYHDSCYLGRYNDVYGEPREVLRAIDGLELLEVPYWNESRGLCCGAGGAQMFKEESGPERINEKRTGQLLATGAKTLASACPFCMTMLTDGLKAEEKEESVRQLDLAELLLESLQKE